MAPESGRKLAARGAAQARNALQTWARLAMLRHDKVVFGAV